MTHLTTAKIISCSAWHPVKKSLLAVRLTKQKAPLAGEQPSKNVKRGLLEFQLGGELNAAGPAASEERIADAHIAGCCEGIRT